MISGGAWALDSSDIFVARRIEMDGMRRWSDRAWNGDVVIVGIVGDPGVGKTALVHQMTARWNDDGARVLVAACAENLSIPFLPLLTAFHRAAPIGDAVVSPPGQAPTHALFISMAEELTDLASRERVVLWIDDLQWADPATVDLLAHMLTTALRQSLTSQLTLLVVITSQPTSEDHGAHHLLTRLAREPTFHGVRLEPFDELTSNELLERLLGRRASRRLLGDVLEATGGNPQSIRNVISALDDADALRVEHGEVRSISVVSGEPDDRQRLERRTAGLQPAALTLLRFTAHMGLDPHVDDLRHIADLDLSSMERALDELERIGIAFEQPDGCVTIRDPTVRQTITSSLPRRASERLHLHIATRLQDLVIDDEDPRAIEVAHHLRRAGTRAEPALLFDYACAAMRQATALGAWAKAARYADLAIDSAPRAGRQVDVLDLHLGAALAHFRNHDADATNHHCAAAIEHARARHDRSRWGEALILAGRTRLTLTSDIGADLADYDDLISYLDGEPSSDPTVRARCWLLLAEISMAAGDQARAHRAASQAISSAEASGSNVVIAEAQFAAGLAHFGDLRPDDAERHFDAGIIAARLGDNDWSLAASLVRRALSSFIGGRIDQASSTADAAADVCIRTQHWAEYGLAVAATSASALVAGDLAGAEQTADTALQVHSRSSFPYIPSLAWPVRAYCRAIVLDRQGAQAALTAWAASGVRGATRFEVLVDLLTLPAEQLRERVDADRYRPASANAAHALSAGGLAVDVELGVRLGAQHLLEPALEQLDELAARNAQLLFPIGSSVGRLRGMSLVGLGRTDAGIDLLEATSIDLHDRGCRLEGFRCEVELCVARAAEDPASALPAAEHLAVELRGAGLAAVHARLVELFPLPLGESGQVRRAVIAWDLVASTPMLMRSGDAGYVELLRGLEALVERRLAQFNGVTFKHTGDGLFAWFSDCGNALRCARAVRSDLRARNRRGPEHPMVLRTGIAVGEPVDDRGDLFGATVVIAVRLCDVATDDQILCTADTTVGDAVPTEPIGAIRLKGLSYDVDVHMVP